MADETKTGAQDANTSATKTGTTSETTPTLTKEQVDAMVSKARSDALAEVGRYKKSAEEAIKSVQAIEERLSRLQDDRYQAELEAAKDDPTRLREIRQRQREEKERLTADTDRRKWESEKASYEERLKRAEAIERRDLAREIADEFGVDYKTLEKFGTDRDTMAELAKNLPKSGKAQSGQEGRVTEPPESGKTKGTTGKLTLEDVEKMSPDERARRFKEIAEIPVT